jgi:hypothetical protein
VDYQVSVLGIVPVFQCFVSSVFWVRITQNGFTIPILTPVGPSLKVYSFLARHRSDAQSFYVKRFLSLQVQRFELHYSKLLYDTVRLLSPLGLSSRALGDWVPTLVAIPIIESFSRLSSKVSSCHFLLETLGNEKAWLVGILFYPTLDNEQAGV